MVLHVVHTVWIEFVRVRREFFETEIEKPVNAELYCFQNLSNASLPNSVC